MSIEDEYKLLARLELFEDLDPIQLKRLIFVSQRYELQAGEYLFKQGDAMGSVFGVLKGELSVILETSRGEIIAAHQKSGDLVGEMAAITGEPRNASIRADTDCEVIGFDKSLFISTVINDPATALKMMQLLTEQLKTQNQQLARIKAAQQLE